MSVQQVIFISHRLFFISSVAFKPAITFISISGNHCIIAYSIILFGKMSIYLIRKEGHDVIDLGMYLFLDVPFSITQPL